MNLKTSYLNSIMGNKIGLLGGTFNPIHVGHIELGLKMLKAFQLDKVMYVLSAYPPHKEHGKIVPTEIRWKMLQKALKPFPELVPCEIEMNRSNLSWTYLTVQTLKKESPDDRFYFISGSEGFLKIRTWKNYRSLLDSILFIVALRKKEHKKKIKDFLKEENVSLCLDRKLERDPPCVCLYCYDSENLQISSTLIRQRVKNAESLEYLVQKGVKKIMEEEGLYGD